MTFPVYTNPVCPRCGALNRFGIREIEVQNANYRHYAVLCMSCGCVVGTETAELIDRMNKIDEKLYRAGIR